MKSILRISFSSKFLFAFAAIIFAANTLLAISKPESCQNVNLDRFMHTGQLASAAPDKIYKFTEIKAELLRSIETTRNMQCYADFYESALSEVGDYWGSRLAQAGCEVNARGEITGSCPEASEARRSVQYVNSLDREFRNKLRTRLAESREARAQARGAAGRTEECAVEARSPALSAQEIKDNMCCGNARNNAGVVRAVLPGTNYNSCLGKIRPTSQNFLSGSGLADCLGNAVKGAAQMLWDSISSIFKLPGELWAARSQIWALITSSQARAQFARALMQQFKAFFTDRVEAFKCFNDYEKAQYVCRVGGQIVATAALPQTIGAFLGLATKPVGAAARAITQILQKSPRGNSILGGISKANEAAVRGMNAAGSAARRVGTAADDLTGGRLSAAADRAGGAGRTVAGVTRAVGRPLSAIAERLAAKIENSATFQRMFVNSFRAERTAMGRAPSTSLARAQALEGEVLPPEPRAPAAPSNAPRIANDNVIEGDFRVVDEPGAGSPGRAAAAIESDTPTGARSGTVDSDAVSGQPAAPSTQSAITRVNNSPTRSLDERSGLDSPSDSVSLNARAANPTSTPEFRPSPARPIERAQAQRLLDNAAFSGSDRAAFNSAVAKYNLQPNQSVTVGSAKYSLSDSFDIGGGRVGVLAIVESGGKTTTQILYRSNSQGVFRLLPGRSEGGWFSKGAKGVGETSLDVPSDLQRVLADRLNSNQIRSDVPQDFINKVVPIHEGHGPFGQYNATMAATKDPNLNVQRIEIVTDSPKPLKNTESGLNFSKPQDLRLKNPALTPEFKQGPVQTYMTSTDAAGKVRANVFRSQDGSLEYTFFEDSEGKAWLASVQNVNASINPAGIRSLSVDSDALTMPRFEYHQQIPDGYAVRGVARGNRGDYGDAWPYLKETPLIKEYYRSRGLPIPP